jgi:hypothetical protein
MNATLYKLSAEFMIGVTVVVFALLPIAYLYLLYRGWREGRYSILEAIQIHLFLFIFGYGCWYLGKYLLEVYE